MYRTSTTAADERIRAARAACGERERLIAMRTALAEDVVEANQHADQLAAVLKDEEKDVRRYQRGVWAFLYDIFADREARLTKEQLEAAAALGRYQEAATARDRLTESVADVDQRIAALEGAAAELEAARVAKRAALLAAGGATAEQLERINEDAGRIVGEVIAIDEALAAGYRALAALNQLAGVLSSARSWGAVDIFSDSLLISWAKRNKLDEARGLAGQAQAEVTVFQRELADVGVALDTEMTALADHHRFLDTWFDNIFSDLSVQGRIKDAQDTTLRAVERVGYRMTELQTRRAMLDQRRTQLMASHESLIEPAP